jgi:deoxyribonuclease-4
MKAAAHTFGFVWQESAEASFEALATAGFRHVQLLATLPHFDPWQDDPARTARLRAIIERHGLSVLAGDLASSDINLASTSPDVVGFAVDAYRRLIARCAELGAAAVCVGSGRRHALLAKANDRLMESFRPAFREIVAEARRQGVGVALENHPQGLLADAVTIRDFLDSEGYADVSVIYDVANAVAIGEDPVEGLATLQARISLVHLSDSPPGQWRHDPIGSGAIDFAAIGRELKRQAYDGPVVLEILSDTPLEHLLDGIRRLVREGWSFAELPRL